MREKRAEPERLQKLLAHAGLASRRQAEDWIRAGRLTINGRAASLGVRVGPGDEIRLDGRLIRQRPPQSGGRAYLYHRSPGERLEEREATGDTSRAASLSAPEALPLLARLPKRGGRRFIQVSPMPRIDGGLELVCGDGELTARLQRSVRRLVSELSVRVRGELSEPQLEGVRGGVLDSGARLSIEKCEPAGGEGANRWYAIAALGASGKDVRQLFERQGVIVSRVLRTRLGSLALERSLARGSFRELTAEELQALLQPPLPGHSPEAGATRPVAARSRALVPAAEKKTGDAALRPPGHRRMRRGRGRSDAEAARHPAAPVTPRRR